MKFRRYYRPEEGIKGITPRRLSAAKRALLHEQNKLPLFAGMIAATQPTPEERIQKIDAGRVQDTIETRKRRADQWRKGRAQLRGLSAADQKGILHYWNNSMLPKDPEYFLDLIRNWTVNGWRPAVFTEEDKKKWKEGRERVNQLFAQWKAEGRIKDIQY